MLRAQGDDVFQRLRRALPLNREGEQAAEELANRNFAAVEEMLNTAQATDPHARAELMALRAAVNFLAGDMHAAVKDFDEAGRLSPLSENDNFTLAMALVNAGDDARARSVLSGLAERHPQRAIYLYWLGRIDYNQRRYEEAVEKLQKASELDPSSARVWDSLGLAFDMQGRMEQALDGLERAANLNRRQAHPSPWPPHDLGYLLLRMEKTAEAEAALREALGYDPQMPEAHYHLARALEKEDHNEDAAAEYGKAIAEDKQSPDACYSLGMLYRKMQRDKDAEAMFAEWKKRKEAQPLPELTKRRQP
jgi:tetratricopeptide (TPR) repeat protein